MSDTPETDALVEDMGMGCEMVDAWFARKLERERDEAIVSRKASAADWLINVEQANARTTRALQQTVLAERERDEAREALEIERAEHSITELERDEANAQMRQAIGHLSDIAETCQDWLDSIIQEPAVDFIKAIRDWAKKKASGENK